MSAPYILEDRIERAHLARGRAVLRVREEAEPAEAVRRPALAAVQLALAHGWATAIARGDYGSCAELAAELKLTRARVSQLMDLTLLAPDIQEDVLFLETVDGQEPLGEAKVRRVLKAGDWSALREAWRKTLAQGDRRRASVRRNAAIGE
jgi:hypothetical protein